MFLKIFKLKKSVLKNFCCFLILNSAFGSLENVRDLLDEKGPELLLTAGWFSEITYKEEKKSTKRHPYVNGLLILPLAIFLCDKSLDFAQLKASFLKMTENYVEDLANLAYFRAMVSNRRKEYLQLIRLNIQTIAEGCDVIVNHSSGLENIKYSYLQLMLESEKVYANL